jgi:uncharacterized protein YprB with RNaseH-like and TPR domain
MFDRIDLTSVLFLDIETVPQYPDFDLVPEKGKALWEKKSTFIKRDVSDTASSLYNRAGIYAEFGKIVCISVGYFSGYGVNRAFRVKSFYGEDEKQVLANFAGMLTKHFSEAQQVLCAHNGKEFDFPYLCRRMLINGIAIPGILNNAGKKPWEVQHLDTMEMWKFGDFKSFTSLELLAYVFDIPTPKEDIDGSMVGDVYWKHKDLERIKIYCQKDVITLAQLILKFRNENLLTEADIAFVA